VKRVITFAMMFGVVGYIAHKVVQRIAYPLDVGSFWIGIGVAGVTGLVWFQLGEW
jgi:hypothetical protein